MRIRIRIGEPAEGGGPEQRVSESVSKCHQNPTLPSFALLKLLVGQGRMVFIMNIVSLEIEKSQGHCCFADSWLNRSDHRCAMC